MDVFENISEQPEAKRLLREILHELRPHLEAGTPVVVLEPSCLAVFRDELVNLFPDDADAQRLSRQSFLLADFLRKHRPEYLKDLEEPPPYAVIVLVADDLGPLPETIRSRCQLVPFTRLSERAIREEIDARAPGLEPDEAASLARLASGRLDRAARLLDPESARRREALLEVARSVYTDPEFEPGAAAQRILDGAKECGAEAKRKAEEGLELLDLPTREAEQRVRRAARGAEREELLASLEELASWYRDLVVVAVGAERAVVHADRRDVLEQDGTTDRLAGAERSCELVRETWRAFEEFNLSPPLALEALFVTLRRELGGHVPSLT